MSLSDVAYDIEQLYIEGNSPQRIGVTLGIPLSMVKDWLNEVGVDASEEELSPHNTINS
jgi:DNA-directed RNA polymerase specialized sigma24 family protein